MSFRENSNRIKMYLQDIFGRGIVWKNVISQIIQFYWKKKLVNN